jgi:hypothetical protein
LSSRGLKPRFQTQNDRLDPELGLIPLPTNMHVHRFRTVEAVEEQPVRPRNSSDARHGEIRLDDLIVAAWRQVRLTIRAEPQRIPALF